MPAQRRRSARWPCRPATARRSPEAAWRWHARRGQSGEARTAQLRQARATIARANRADTEAAELIAYYRSFVDTGQVPPAIAVDGLQKALAAVPNAPATRLALGTALAARGALPAARKTLMPVAHGGYDSPERAEADATLNSIDAR